MTDVDRMELRIIDFNNLLIHLENFAENAERFDTPIKARDFLDMIRGLKKIFLSEEDWK